MDAGEVDRVQRLAPQGFRVRWLVLGITALILLLNYADRSALGVAGPTIMKDLRLSRTEFGFISSIFFVGYAPFCFIGGWLSDRHGPRLVMGVAVGWWSLFTGLTAAGGSYASMLVIRLLFGLGEGPQGSVTVKTMRNWFPQRQMGLSVGLAQGCTPLGGVLGTPLVAGLIAATGDWRVPFLVLAALGLLCTLGWWVVTRDTPASHPWASPGEIEEMSQGDLPVEDTTTPPVGHYLRQPLVLATAVGFFGYSWVLYTFLSWFPVYLVEARGLDLKRLAVVGSLPWLIGVVGYMVGGVTTDWVGRRTGNPAAARKSMIIFALSATSALLACIGLVTTLVSAVLLMSGVVFLMYLSGTQFFLIISDTVPARRLGGVVGFTHFVANLAGVLAPILVGVIVDRTHSWALTFGISGAVCLGGALVLVVWGRLPAAGAQIPSSR